MTSPEELAAAAHSSCFSMALALRLGEHDITPQRLEVTATVSLADVDGRPTVVSSALRVVGQVVDLDGDTFRAIVRRGRGAVPDLATCSPALRSPSVPTSTGRGTNDCNRCLAHLRGCPGRPGTGRRADDGVPLREARATGPIAPASSSTSRCSTRPRPTPRATRAASRSPARRASGVIMITTRLRDTAFKTGPPGDAARHRGQDRRAVRGPAPAPRRPAGRRAHRRASASPRSGASCSRPSEPVACRTASSSSTPIVGRRTRPSSTSSASWPGRTRTSPSFRRCRGWTRADTWDG